MAKTVTTVTGRSGNTKRPPTGKKPEQARTWFFTWNNYSDCDIVTLRDWLENQEKLLYVFQEEKGENGTIHLQGCFKKNTGIRFCTLKKEFPEVHWEKCKNWDKAILYCSKEETRNGEIYTNIELPEPLLDPLKYIDVLYDWQEYVMMLYNLQREWRIVHWFYNKSGNIGKTSFARHMMIQHPGQVIYLDGKSADMLHIFSENMDKGMQCRLAFFNFTRKLEGFVSYSTIEKIKDGICCSGKYESKGLVFNPPHVVCLANFLPDEDALSADRWYIYEIYEDGSFMPMDELDSDRVYNNDYDVLIETFNKT